MADLPMFDGCRSDNMFDDKPDNQPVYYTKSGLSNDVGLDPWWFFVVSKFQTETKKWGAQQAQQEIHHCMITDMSLSNHGLQT
jgi:hypothetical protein